MIDNPPSLNTLILALAAFGLAFLVALWVSLVVWTSRDIRARSQDGFTRFLAVLLVAILTVPGLIIYRILRPRRTLAEEYQDTLEEEALLQFLEQSSLCPGCSRRVHTDWLVCPKCHTRLGRSCPHCGKPMDPTWDICPACGTPVTPLAGRPEDQPAGFQTWPAGEDPKRAARTAG